MDPLVQGLAGAVAGQIIAKKETSRWAAFCGAVGGMLPDLDILIRSHNDPLMAIEYHRHFTHSLFFVPVGGLIAACLLWLVLRKKLTFKQLYIFATAGYATHGLIDAMTSYGTYLYWPLSNARIAWDMMPIIDPIVTVLLSLAVIGMLISLSRKWLVIFTSLFLLYCGFGALQSSRVSQAVHEKAAEQGHVIEKLRLNPTIFNTVLWRTVYLSDGVLYVNAFRSNIFGDITYYGGEQIVHYTDAMAQKDLGLNTVQYQDFKRFNHFANGFLARTSEDPYFLADMRYAMLPYSTKSMWGIRINPERPDQHVVRESFGRKGAKPWAEFWLMLKGKKEAIDKER